MHDTLLGWADFFLARKGHRKARWRRKLDRWIRHYTTVNEKGYMVMKANARKTKIKYVR